MNRFEKEVESVFEVYELAGVATMAMMPVPMFPAGNGKFGMTYRPKGKAPFDCYGWDTRGKFVGAELKESSKPETSMAILGPGKRGKGLDYHQIMSLVGVHKSNGVARLLWCNAGQVGVLSGEGIWNHWSKFEAARLTELQGKKAKQGMKSIPWSAFRTDIPLLPGTNQEDWLGLTDL